MTVSISITQNNVMRALGLFLTNILPTGIGIFQAQTNRVSEPMASDFVVMNAILQEKIETNTTTYMDAYPDLPQARYDLSPTKVTMQVDVHGPQAGNNAQLISNLFRTDYACDFFVTTGFDISPLYSSDPKQIPFLNGEQQIEERWVVDVCMQSNPITTVAQQFADAVEVGVISVEATYPAE